MPENPDEKCQDPQTPDEKCEDPQTPDKKCDDPTKNVRYLVATLSAPTYSDFVDTGQLSSLLVPKGTIGLEGFVGVTPL